MLHIKHSAWHYTGDEFKYALHSAVHVHECKKQNHTSLRKRLPSVPTRSTRQ